MNTEDAVDRFSLAVDVGGTKTLIAVVTADGRICDEFECPTRSTGEGEPAASDAARIVQLLERAVVRRREKVATRSALSAIALGVPEYVTPDGRVSSDEVLAGMEDLAALLHARCAANGWEGVRVIVDSDVRLGAVGEHATGAGRRLSSFAYLSIGTGLSCAIVLDGTVWSGHRGEAIALGEWAVPQRSGMPAAGAMNLEQYVSGAGIARRYANATGESIPTRLVTERAAAGDPAARVIVESAGAAAGRAAAMLVDVLDPERVVLGGGLGSSTSLYRDALEEAYTTATSRRPAAPELITAQNGPRAGLIGAATVLRSLRG